LSIQAGDPLLQLFNSVKGPLEAAHPAGECGPVLTQPVAQRLSPPLALLYGRLGLA